MRNFIFYAQKEDGLIDNLGNDFIGGIKAIFHEWGLNILEENDTYNSYSIAIIELDNIIKLIPNVPVNLFKGRVLTVSPNRITF